MVRIPGFHPGGPGSIPGMGTFFYFFMCSFAFLDSAAILIKPIDANITSTADDVKRELASHEPVGDTVQTCEVTVVKVPLTKPFTRVQYKQAVSYWPVTFHEDKRYVHCTL